MMPGSGSLRLAEAAAVLSLATDLAMGQPLEHGLRTAVLAVRTAAALGLPEQDLAAVFYTGLLHFAGCTAGSEIDARFLGDELAVRPQLMGALYGSRLGLVTTAVRAVYPGSPPACAGSGGGQVCRRRPGGVPPVGRQPLRGRGVAGRSDGPDGAGSGCAAAPVRAVGWQGAAGGPARRAGPRAGAGDAGGSGRRHRLAARRSGAGPAQAEGPGGIRAGSAGRGRLLGARRSGVRGPGCAVGLGGGAGRRAGAAAGDRRGPDGCLPVGDGGLRGPEKHVDDRPLPRCRRPGQGGSRGRRAGRGGGGPVAPGGAGARHRPGRRPCPGVGQAGPADPRRTRAGTAARLSQRAGPGHRSRAAAAGPAGRLARRAVRRVGLSPRQPGRGPAAYGAAAGRRRLLPGDAGAAAVPARTVARPTRPTNCYSRRRRAGSRRKR